MSEVHVWCLISSTKLSRTLGDHWRVISINTLWFKFLKENSDCIAEHWFSWAPSLTDRDNNSSQVLLWAFYALNTWHIPKSLKGSKVYLHHHDMSWYTWIKSLDDYHLWLSWGAVRVAWAPRIEETGGSWLGWQEAVGVWLTMKVHNSRRPLIMRTWSYIEPGETEMLIRHLIRIPVKGNWKKSMTQAPMSYNRSQLHAMHGAGASRTLLSYLLTLPHER